MPPMRLRAVATLAFFVLLASCGKGGQARLQGHWKGIKATGVSDTVLSSANLYAANMELDFKGDQVKVISGSETQTGRFRDRPRGQDQRGAHDRRRRTDGRADVHVR